MVRLSGVKLHDHCPEMKMPAWQSHWHKHPGVRSGDQLWLGERSADRMRNVMGSWPFVFGFFAVMIVWAIVDALSLRARASPRKRSILIRTFF